MNFTSTMMETTTTTDSSDDSSGNFRTACVEEDSSPKLEVYIPVTIIVDLYCVILTAISVYFLRRFYAKRTLTMISSRHPKLTIAIVLLSIPITAILVPIAVDFYTLECIADVSVFRTRGEDKNPTKRVEETIIILFLVFFFAYMFAIVTRVWILRFEYERNRAIRASKWKENLGVAQLAEDWYSEHKNTYGNEFWVLKRLSIPYVGCLILFIIVSPIWDYMNDDWIPLNVTVSICAVITLGFIVLNVWKIRSIHDNFDIRNEIMLMAKISVGFAVWQMIVFIIGRASGEVLWDYTVLMFSVSAEVLFLGVNYVQTGWVLNAIQRKQVNSRLSTHIDPDEEDSVSLQDIIINMDGFEIFMDFLADEFSTENLLCYVECTQFLRKWRLTLKQTIRESIIKEKGITLEEYHAQRRQTQENNLKDVQDNRSRQTSQGPDALLKRLGQNIKKDMARAADVITHSHGVSIDEAKQDMLPNDEPEDPEEDEELIGTSLNPDMVNRFRFLPLGQIVTARCTMYEHVRYLEMRYIKNTSKFQVNIRSSLYRAWAKLDKDDCEVDNWREHHASIISRTQSQINTSEVELEEVSPKSETPQRMGSMGVRRRRKPEGVFKIIQLIMDTRSDLWKLMQDSFLRFRGTKEYAAFVESNIAKAQKEKEKEKEKDKPKDPG